MLDGPRTVSPSVAQLDTLGKRIKWARWYRERKMHTRLARQAGFSARTIKRWQEGETRPSDEDLAKLADALEVRAEWLRTGDGPILIPASLVRFAASERAKTFDPDFVADLFRFPFHVVSDVDPDDEEMLSVIVVLRNIRDAAELRRQRRAS
jgi:transcriptional regulator with XRE-family HTH domain